MAILAIKLFDTERAWETETRNWYNERYKSKTKKGYEAEIKKIKLKQKRDIKSETDKG